MVTQINESEARLLTAKAKAENTGSLLRVVDESLKRAAELREQRESRRREERLAEARRARGEEAERLERQQAEELSERHRVQAAAVVEDRERIESLRRDEELGGGVDVVG